MWNNFHQTQVKSALIQEDATTASPILASNLVHYYGIILNQDVDLKEKKWKH